MKAFVLVLTLVLASHFVDVESRMTVAQIKNALKGVRKACVAKVGVSTDLIDDTHKGVFAEDRALMCYLLCCMGMMKTVKNGRYSSAAAAAQVEALLPIELIDRAKVVSIDCAAQMTSEDDCEAAWQFAKCGFEMDKEVYFFP
ncbi:general odorant-binding protein 72-like isoform X1 [Neodiprion fabricii]|uniref:general odorant-binding protein 72-like isoform X1 n=2 Tax=Neodiprion fabricii TaxID=2872261 RepID=UPI001ED8C55D|nr:general odorant-binding protein 72-like isoform X1 [Neodiprion fabricii]